MSYLVVYLMIHFLETISEKLWLFHLFKKTSLLQCTGDLLVSYIMISKTFTKDHLTFVLLIVFFRAASSHNLALHVLISLYLLAYIKIKVLYNEILKFYPPPYKQLFSKFWSFDSPCTDELRISWPRNMTKKAVHIICKFLPLN